MMIHELVSNDDDRLDTTSNTTQTGRNISLSTMAMILENIFKTTGQHRTPQKHNIFPVVLSALLRSSNLQSLRRCLWASPSPTTAPVAQELWSVKGFTVHSSLKSFLMCTSP